MFPKQELFPNRTSPPQHRKRRNRYLLSYTSPTSRPSIRFALFWLLGGELDGLVKAELPKVRVLFCTPLDMQNCAFEHHNLRLPATTNKLRALPILREPRTDADQILESTCSYIPRVELAGVLLRATEKARGFIYDNQKNNCIWSGALLKHLVAKYSSCRAPFSRPFQRGNMLGYVYGGMTRAGFPRPSPSTIVWPLTKVVVNVLNAKCDACDDPPSCYP